ncbi:MAG: DUF2807 domain-containing protein [Rikenellaceae bacterium]|nr:DUF2807 domain-containing protein [Rikenellaceae bacterium]
MKKLVLLTAVFLCAGAATAQEVVSHKLNDFNQISLNGTLNVVLEQGEENSFEVTLHNTDADRFTWSTTDRKLALRLRANTRQQASADVKIIYKQIDALDVVSSSVRTENPIQSDLFELKLANGANVTIGVQAKDFTVHAEGNSAASLSGNTLYLHISAASKSKIDARGVESRSAVVNSTLNGEVFVWATERLEAKAGSNSVIFYKGIPEIFKQSTNLMGSIEQFSY